MEPVSQVILRNEDRLPAGPVLLVNPPRDALALQLQRDDRSVRCSTQDFGDFRWLQGAGADVGFGMLPAGSIEEPVVILNLPRERERLSMLLHAFANQLDPQAQLWLVGENRAGIKSSARHLQPWFRQVTTLDNARHCVLFEASQAVAASPLDIAEYTVSWSTRYSGQDIRLLSLPGVFAHGRLDRGTALLLETLPALEPGGRILDFACGCGIVGLALLATANATTLTFLDSSALALESCRQSLALNGLQGDLVPSDGLSELQTNAVAPFDWIVSNPPFHRGVASDLEIAADFFGRAGTFLSENGRIVIVFNRHLPYSQWLRNAFDRVERLADSGEFIVLQASRPLRPGRPGWRM
jgi:16S rRNA (guanine1207-N2)-methyltransferase